MRPGIIVDIETTGLNPCLNYMTSFAFVEFDENFKINQAWNLRIPNSKQPSSRGSDPDTLHFRKREAIDCMELEVPIADSPFRALRTVQEFFFGVGVRQGDFDLWARHTEFDIAFFAAYFREHGLDIPWPYRAPSDIPTLHKFLENTLPGFSVEAVKDRAKRSVEFRKDIEDHCSENAAKHDAMYDAILDMHILKETYEYVVNKV